MDFEVQIPFGLPRVEIPRAGAFPMKRRTLLIISLSLSIVGIIALFFLKPEVSPQSLQMSGVIKYISQKEKVAFISFIPEKAGTSN